MIQNSRKLYHSSLTLCIFVLTLFALNLWVLVPALSTLAHPNAGLIIYNVIKILGMIGLSLALGRWAGRNRFQTLSTLMGVVFIEQVFFKWIALQFHLGGEVMDMGAMSLFEQFYALSTGFLFFAPFILILGFLGFEMRGIFKKS